MKPRSEIAAFAAGLMIAFGENEPRWDVIAAQLEVAGVGVHSPAEVEMAVAEWVGRNCQDDISAPTVGEAVARMGTGRPS